MDNGYNQRMKIITVVKTSLCFNMKKKEQVDDRKVQGDISKGGRESYLQVELLPVGLDELRERWVLRIAQEEAQAGLVLDAVVLQRVLFGHGGDGVETRLLRAEPDHVLALHRVGSRWDRRR